MAQYVKHFVKLCFLHFDLKKKKKKKKKVKSTNLQL